MFHRWFWWQMEFTSYMNSETRWFANWRWPERIQAWHLSCWIRTGKWPYPIPKPVLPQYGYGRVEYHHGGFGYEPKPPFGWGQ
jgi:hypothetical protein